MRAPGPLQAMSAELVSTRGAFAANEQQSRLSDPEVQVYVRGDQRTFELRERLRAAGMHWLPDSCSWSGIVPESFVPQMQAEGLQVVPLVPEGHRLDRFAERESVTPVPSERVPAHKPRSRPRKEVHVRLSDEQRAGVFLPEHGWDTRDITANLADDTREADERRVERRLRDLRSRVKSVRALINADPFIQVTLATNPEKAAAFYAIHGVTSVQVRQGVPDVNVAELEWEELVEALHGQYPMAPACGDWTSEETERANAILPGPEEPASGL